MLFNELLIIFNLSSQLYIKLRILIFVAFFNCSKKSNLSCLLIVANLCERIFYCLIFLDGLQKKGFKIKKTRM